MEKLVHTYADKLIQAGLGQSSGPSQPLVGGLDDLLVWNRDTIETTVLEGVFERLNINSLIFLRPAQPYKSLIQYLGDNALSADGVIEPKDCETRTFLHDLPVIDTFCPDRICAVLKNSKSVIIIPKENSKTFDGPAIVAHGTVSPEQGFVTISSVCFASFIKFFTDYLEDLQTAKATPAAHALFDAIVPGIQKQQLQPPDLIRAPFTDEKTVYQAIVQAGKKTVEYQLVDSYFGNVSYLWEDTLYISQTGSSLDELAHCIDPVPLDQSSSAGLTASSELTAHLETIARTGCRAILHGHPRFSVILSMDCDPTEKAACQFNTQCHIRCPKKRFVEKTPIVPGEVGTGPNGLCNTLPAALENMDNAIVYGHGLFTTSNDDFNHAFETLLSVENRCQSIYFEKIQHLRTGR